MGKEVLTHPRARRRYGLAYRADISVNQQIKEFLAGDMGMGWEDEEEPFGKKKDHEFFYETVRDELVDIDMRIRKKSKRNRDGLPELYEMKNTLVLLALQLRRDGEEKIRVKTRNSFRWSDKRGLSGQCKISFLDNGTKETYSTFTNLFILRARVSDLPSLIGRPDGYLTP